MTTSLALLLAVAAAQAAEPAEPPAAPPPPASRAEAPKKSPEKGAFLEAAVVVPAELHLVAEGSPALRWGTPSRCLDRDHAYYRVQCDEGTRRCLVAPDAELDTDGKAAAQLERAPACVGPALQLGDLTSRGYAVAAGLAEAPPGWYRDERQRVMQTDFDLNARFFLGAGGAVASGGTWDGGFTFSSGGRLDRPITWWGAPALVRMHFLEGTAAADGTQGELLAFGIDASRVYPTPLLRITTFVGKPRRFDPPLYIGLWAEGLRLERLETRAGESYDRTVPVAAAFTLDMWRSRDLSDFVRIRVGGGYEQSRGGDWSSWVPHAALEGELTLGRSGFHHLRASAQSELLVDAGGALPAGLDANRSRVTVKGEYEVILFAINNQPISLAVEAKAQKRDDVPDFDTGWQAMAGASLRFSAWAPPRRNAKSQDEL